MLQLSLVSHMVSVQMGRSTGFSQGGSYGSNRHLLQQQQPAGNASDLHLHAGGVGDSYSPARVSASYHSQVRFLYKVIALRKLLLYHLRTELP